MSKYNKEHSTGQTRSSHLTKKYEAMMQAINLRLDKLCCKYAGIVKYGDNGCTTTPEPKVESIAVEEHVSMSDLGNKSSGDESDNTDVYFTSNDKTNSSESDDVHMDHNCPEIEQNESENQCNEPVEFITFKHALHEQLRDKYKVLKGQATAAYKNRKIFIIYGNFNSVQDALLSRGWLEKFTPAREKELAGCKLEELLSLSSKGNKYEAAFLSKLMQRYPAYFVWQNRGQEDFFKKFVPFRNCIRRSVRLDFTSKIGMIKCVEQVQHNRVDGICMLKYPRFYKLCGQFEESEKLINDFYKTQCRNFIRFITNYDRHYEQIIDEQKGSIPATTITFALQCLETQLLDDEYKLNNDMGITGAKKLHWLWKEFIERSNKVLNKKAKLKVNLVHFISYAQRGKYVLNILDKKYPQFKWDGICNIWILKPAYASCGSGIIITGNIEHALNHANKNYRKQYIAQKYIERPLLIYKTKFDIRAYMLMTVHSSAVHIWLYKDCYFKLCSNKFTISDLRERVHLTNNAVQKNFRNETNRDIRLPNNNMWNLKQFKKYLKKLLGSEKVWSTVIFPEFVSSLITVATAYLNEVTYTNNTFELYGCDFMIDENFHPILIEINSSPALSPSTSVTKALCPLVLKDVVKVVVDLTKDSNASTGNFQLIFGIKDIDTFVLTSCNETNNKERSTLSLVRSEKPTTTTANKKKYVRSKKRIVHEQAKKRVKIVQKNFTSSKLAARAREPELAVEIFEKKLFDELAMESVSTTNFDVPNDRKDMKSLPVPSSIIGCLRNKPLPRQFNKPKPTNKSSSK